jgi:hypothetical protein
MISANGTKLQGAPLNFQGSVWAKEIILVYSANKLGRLNPGKPAMILFYASNQ